MPSRRSHTKSHHGCLQCKQRRVKCDETAPVCNRCARRQMQCSFMTNAASFANSSATNGHVETHTPGLVTIAAHRSNASTQLPTLSAAPVNVARSSSTSDPILRSQLKEFSRLDLELIHFFSTQTYMTMTSRLNVHAVWRDVVFEHALKYDFLLQALMATAALHKASGFTENSESHVELTKAAFVYQDAALAGYIPALNQPTEQNAVALFILSTLLTIWLFATKKLPETLDESSESKDKDRVDLARPRLSTGTGNEQTDIVEVVTRIHGINAVFKQTVHWLYESKAKPMLNAPTDADLPRTLPEDIEATFKRLWQKIEHVCQSPDKSTQEKYNIYLERFEQLRMVSRSRTVLEWDQFIFSWPVTIEPAYIEMIKQRDPVSIALFIHWAACFKSLEHMWWARGWSFRLVRDACALLDNSWAEVVAWPRKEVGLD